MKRMGIAGVAGMALLLASCAQLGLSAIVQPPRFSTVSGRDAEIRLLGPSAGRPLGGAAVRIYAHVENPNTFGLNLTRLAGDLFLEDTRAADVSFPLGLPLTAQQDTVIPIEIALSFSELGDLADVVSRVFTSNQVDYRLDGTLSIDAGALGEPSFGPQTWLQGSARVFR
ncbi:MAG: LEA type 2 family protein [Longimicrobiales bacterium]